MIVTPGGRLEPVRALYCINCVPPTDAIHRPASEDHPSSLQRISYQEGAPVEASADTEQEIRDQAIERLKKKRDFKTHVLMYVTVNAFLVVIWAISDSGFFWPIFPILGWGIGVIANAWDVYGRKPISEEEIRREVDRLRQ